MEEEKQSHQTLNNLQQPAEEEQAWNGYQQPAAWYIDGDNQHCLLLWAILLAVVTILLHRVMSYTRVPIELQESRTSTAEGGDNMRPSSRSRSNMSFPRRILLGIANILETVWLLFVIIVTRTCACLRCVCRCFCRCPGRCVGEVRTFCQDVRRIFIWLLHRPIRRHLWPRLPPILKLPLHENEPEEVFGQGDNGYSSFRIPALVYHKGVFLAFCEARKTSFRDWGSHMDLVLRRGKLREDKEKDKQIEWGDIHVVASITGKRAMNPVPIVDEDTDTIILLFITFPIELSEADLIRGEAHQQNVYVTRSVDNGQNWSEPQDITEQTLGRIRPEPLIYASGPGHGLQLKSGRIIVPGNIHWKEKPEEGTGAGGWLSDLKWSIMEFFDSFHGSRNCSIVLFSDDGGDTWQVGGKIPPAKDENGEDIPANECQAAELEEGHVYINSRTCNPTTTRQESYSIDGGISFTMGELSELPEPGYFLSKWIPSIKNFGGCQASILSFEPPEEIPRQEHDAERWIIFSNPASSYTRVNMSVRYSRDACMTWSPPLSLNPGPSAYSDITAYRMRNPATGRDIQRFACLYECGSLHPYERLAFQTFSLEELMTHSKNP